MRQLEIMRADPAGNITLFVLTPVEKKDYTSIAGQLLAMESLRGEQVGFLCPEGRMEMAAGEFCGNATRAYGYLLARNRGLTGRQTMILTVSGCDHPVKVEVDVDAGTALAEMPVPRFAEKRTVDGVEGTLVHLGGIAHFVVEDVTPDVAFFEKAEPQLREDPALEAYGVCFLRDGSMTPLVKVPRTGALLFEGSCGSGSVACAIARSEGAEGDYSVRLSQPAGEVIASVRREAGRVVACSIGGGVSLEPSFLVTLE